MKRKKVEPQRRGALAALTIVEPCRRKPGHRGKCNPLEGCVWADPAKEAELRELRRLKRAAVKLLGGERGERFITSPDFVSDLHALSRAVERATRRGKR